MDINISDIPAQVWVVGFGLFGIFYIVFLALLPKHKIEDDAETKQWKKEWKKGGRIF